MALLNDAANTTAAEHLWNRYSSAAVTLLRSKDASALERVKQHQAQMKAVAG